MGGSFDPPHLGHLHLIKVAQTRLGLDWVWIVPAAGNPLKRTATSYRDRLAAAERTLKGPRVKVSSIEGQLGLVYTIDLIERLKRLCPHARFVWIMGADNLSQFDRWRSWRKIASLVPICVVSRPQYGPRPLSSRFARTFSAQRLPAERALSLPFAHPPAWVYLPAPLDPTTSTELRVLMTAAAATPPI